jgi:GNAT superfamily N-acetyltransferase
MCNAARDAGIAPERRVTGAREPCSVELLAEHRDCIDLRADWFEREWEPYYGTRGPGDARADLAARCNRDRLPIGFVAILDDRVRGTAALDRDAATGLTPSLVGLLVAPDCRGRGIAAALIAAAESVARELGYRELFTSTSILGERLEREGWQAKEDVQFLNGEPGRIYRRVLV